MEFALQEIARVLDAATPHDGVVRGWSVDSRSIQPGDLFFALRGPNHDGHSYVRDVLAKGALAAIVDRAVEQAAPVLTVPDTLAALQRLAGWARDAWGGEVVGVTGSAGKTSTKDAIAAALSGGIRTGKTIGNFNNHVGVPLSVLRLPLDARVAVLELGMNHAGEIRGLAAIARPRVGVVTNVGYAHIENFDSIDGIAAAKRELIEALPADGLAVLNADDPRVRRFADSFRGRSVLYGIESADAEVRAESVEYLPDGVRFRSGGQEFSSPWTGRHSVLNLLAAIAVARHYGVGMDLVAAALRDLLPGKMRGERIERNGVVIWNDCYNANPDAMRSMIDVLAGTPATRRIAVLGEMLELGAQSSALHAAVGRYAAEREIDIVVAIRGEARSLACAASPAEVHFFESPDEAGAFLRSAVRSGDAILFKGSRGTRVEIALERFLA